MLRLLKTPSDDNICRTCHTESYLYEVWTDSAAKFRLPGVDGGETPCGKEYKDNKNQEVPGSKGQTLCWYFEWIVSLSRKRYSMYDHVCLVTPFGNGCVCQVQSGHVVVMCKGDHVVPSPSHYQLQNVWPMSNASKFHRFPQSKLGHLVREVHFRWK